MKCTRAERREVALALLALEDLIGEAEIRAHEFVGKDFPRRRGGKQRVQSKRPAEDRFVVGNAPLAKLGLDARGRILDQHSGETLEADAAWKSLLMALRE